MGKVESRKEKVMNVVLLMVALAGPVEAPKPVMLVPPALVTAAVPSVRIAPEGNSAAESAAPEAQLPSGGSVNEAVAQAQTFPESSVAQSAKPGECRIADASQVEDAEMEASKVAASAVDSTTDAVADAPIFGEVALGKTDGMSPSVALEDAKPIGEATPRKTSAMPEPKSDADCSLIGIYAKKRMLSGPWSASRRLKAARIRGDEDEAKRMEAMLDDLLGKAIFDEPD